MANFVRNDIRFIGNDKVDDCMREIVLRLRMDNEPNDTHGTGKIGRVLYGLSGDDAFLSYDEIGGKWIYFEYEDDERLTVTTGWDPARKFQDYLLEKLVTLDPNVIISMQYDDESPRFVGVRYVLMDDMEIQSYERELDTSEYTIVGLEDVEEKKQELAQEDSESEVISWDDFWDKQSELLAEAYDELKADYPQAYKDPALRWREK